MIEVAEKAAKKNYDIQNAFLGVTQNILVYRQAVTDYGNARINKENALTQYNTELARLERQTGTILETHGVAFYEERYGSLGPLGRWRKDISYPADLRPTPNDDRYPSTTPGQPSEDSFDLKPPASRRPQRNLDDIELPREQLPAPKPTIPPSPPGAKPVSVRVRNAVR